MDSFPTVAVVGLGYIGLPTATVLAESGCRVIGIDVDEHRVATINEGKAPFVEPDLEEALSRAVASGALRAQLDMPEAEAYIIAVPTPFKGDHEADLSYVHQAAEKIAPVLADGALVILESTSPPGATEAVAETIQAARPNVSLSPSPGKIVVHFVHCPERVLPGRIMIELAQNDRIVGGLTPEAAKLAAELYSSFCRGELLLTDARTAEMTKLTENAFRDVNIAFANELSLICDRLGINVWELIELANHHPRVSILQPGPGVGGHCIAVDPWFIVDAAPEQARLIRTAREINDGKPAFVVEKVRLAVGENAAPTIAVLGLAFKPNIDDLRESPARRIASRLADVYEHGRLLVVEPHIDALPAELAGRDHVVLADVATAIRDADTVVLLVDHDVFKALDPAALAGKAVVDTRGIWSWREGA